MIFRKLPVSECLDGYSIGTYTRTAYFTLEVLGKFVHYFIQNLLQKGG